MISVDRTPEEEASVAVDLLTNWARINRVTIENFALVGGASIENRSLSVLGRTAQGIWMTSRATIENLCPARDVDDAMFALASAKGWAFVEENRKPQ